MSIIEFEKSKNEILKRKKIKRDETGSGIMDKVKALREIRTLWAKEGDVEKCSNKVLEIFEIDAENGSVPIVNILTLFGIKTYQMEMNPRRLSAYISVNPRYLDDYGTTKIACVNEADKLGHKRFALAHELAHYLFDYKEEETTVYYNMYISGDKRNENDPEEIRANEFAACLLMPSKIFKKKYEYFKETTGNSKPDIIAELSEFFGVSPTAVELRFKEVGI